MTHQDHFIKLELSESGSILENLNPHFSGSEFDPLEAVILSRELSFYPGYRLVEISDHSSFPAKKRTVVYSKAGFEILDYSTDPISRLNEKIPVTLNNSNITEYTRFYFNYVRGTHGKFHIVESVDDIHWKEDPPPQARKAIGKMIAPVMLKKSPAAGFELNANMVFGDSLYKAIIKISLDGKVDLISQELLVEDMPLLDDLFSQ